MSDDRKIQLDVEVNIQKAQQQLEQLKKTIKELSNEKQGQLFNSQQTISDLAIINTQMAALNKQVELNFLTWKKTGSEMDKLKYSAASQGLQNFQGHIKTTNEALGTMGQAFRRHLQWLFTGVGELSALGNLANAVKDLTMLEQEFNQLKTVLPEIHENQATYNQAIKDSFALAEKYGESVKNVTDSLRLMGRGYRELSTSEKLAENALKLSVADNFNPEVATRVLESVIGAYGKQNSAIEFSNHAMDSITKVSHTAQISAQDLAEALMRSAAAAHTVGLSFDELNALIAVTARNTGLTGQTIGDGWKSIANSIHSKKAIQALQEFGIEVYKIGASGEREFRKVSDVLLDVSLKAKSTDQNLEKLFLTLGGGKFQANKIAAALGDPNEYLRVLGNSINSSGFTDKQLAIQMDTIQRKAQTLKASFEELLTVGGGHSGFSDSIKGILDTLNQILKGLNNINPVVFSTIGYISKSVVILYTLRIGLNACRESYNLLKGTLVATKVAQEGLNVAAMASPWGSVMKLLGVAAAALGTYAYFAGQATTAQEKMVEAAENTIRSKQSEISMVKQQAVYLETLGNAYVSSSRALENVGDNEEKATELKKVQQTVIEQLTKTVGKEAAERILASDNIKGAIANEQQVLTNKASDMEKALGNLKEQQVSLANSTVNMCNERVLAINNEAEAFDKACDSIKGALGTIDEIMYKHLRTKAKYLNELSDGKIKDEWKIAGINVGDQDISKVTEQIKAEADKATADADEIRDRAISYYTETARKALGTIYTPNSNTSNPFNTSADSTGIVSDSDNSKSKKSKADTSERLWDNHAINQMFQSAKDNAKKYKDALASINDEQERFGVTNENSAAKLALMNARLKELGAEKLKMQAQGNTYALQAETLALSSGELKADLESRGITWQQLSDEEKSSFASFYKNSIADEKMLVFLLEKASKLKSELNNNEIETNGLSREIPKTQQSGIIGKYDTASRFRGYDYGIANEKLKQSDASTMAFEQEKLKETIIELAEAQKEYDELVQSKATPEAIKKQELAVEELKSKVKELAQSDMKKLNAAFASATQDMILNGKSFKDIMKNIWNDIAKDAINALFKIKGQESIWSKVLSGGSGKGKSKDGLNLPKAAYGGVSDKPAIFGEAGEEVAIPLEKHTENSAKLLAYAGSKLGFPVGGSGVEYTPYFKNQSLNTKPVVNVNLQAEQNAKRIEETNSLLKQQNNILLNTTQSGNTTIVTTAVSADQVLQVLSENPDALNNILGRNKSNGYR